jgi:hypothetical protein
MVVQLKRERKHLKLAKMLADHPMTEEPKPSLPFSGDGFEVSGDQSSGKITVVFLGGEFEWHLRDDDVVGMLERCTKMVQLHRKAQKSLSVMEGYARRHGLVRIYPTV